MLNKEIDEADMIMSHVETMLRLGGRLCNDIGCHSLGDIQNCMLQELEALLDGMIILVGDARKPLQPFCV